MLVFGRFTYEGHKGLISNEESVIPQSCTFFRQHFPLAPRPLDINFMPVSAKDIQLSYLEFELP